MINAHMLTINLVKASFDETFEVRRTIIGHSLLHTWVELFEKNLQVGHCREYGLYWPDPQMCGGISRNCCKASSLDSNILDKLAPLVPENLIYDRGIDQLSVAGYPEHLERA